MCKRIQAWWRRKQMSRRADKKLQREIDACVVRFQRGDPDCQLSRIMRQTEGASWD